MCMRIMQRNQIMDKAIFSGACKFEKKVYQEFANSIKRFISICTLPGGIRRGIMLLRITKILNFPDTDWKIDGSNNGWV